MACKYDKYEMGINQWACADPDSSNKWCGCSSSSECECSTPCYSDESTLTDILSFDCSDTRFDMLTKAAEDIIDAYTSDGITPEHIINLARALGVKKRSEHQL